MEIKIRPMNPEEQKYSYTQHQRLEDITWCIGHLQGNFGESGIEFNNHKWFQHWKSYFDNAGFQTELDLLINALHSEEYKVLASRRHMLEYVREFPNSAFSDKESTEYGFRADTEKYAYLIRCNPHEGKYSVYCYVAKFLDRHMEQARVGISFRDAEYQEEFRIPDGGTIICNTPWGAKQEFVCRFVDEHYTEINGHVYHIDEFAEITHREGGGTCQPKTEEMQKKEKDSRKLER